MYWQRNWQTVFNLLPGQGLGFTASKEMAWGLGYVVATDISDDPIWTTQMPSGRSGAIFEDGYYALHKNKILAEDKDLMEILSIIVASEVLE